MSRTRFYACLFAALGCACVFSVPLQAQLIGAPGSNNSDLGLIKPVLVGADVTGNEKQVNLERGPLVVAGAKASGGTVAGGVASVLTMGLFGSGTSLNIDLEVPGKASDSVAPAGLKAINLSGYSQKQHAPFGTPTLIKLIENGDKRTLRIKGDKIDSKSTKNASDRIKLEKADDCWKLLVVQPLEAGHYALIFFSKGGTPTDYWDFDVK